MYYRIFLLLVTLFLTFPVSLSVSAEMVAINNNDVNVRKGPGKNHDIIWQYGQGFPLIVIQRDGEWLNTRDFEGDSGWVHKSLTNSVSHLIVKANRSGKGVINVRKEPNTDSDIIAHAKYGVVFRTIKQQDGWAKVNHAEKNITGWVKRSLLWGF